MAKNIKENPAKRIKIDTSSKNGTEFETFINGIAEERNQVLYGNCCIH